MTKREYMQQLSRALEGYEQGFVQEILESYEEHFEAGLKSGRSEEEICRELGDIEELLREMGDEVEFKKEERPLPKPVTAIEPVQYSGISKVQLNLFSMDAEISRSCDGELHVYLQSGEELSQYLEEQVEGDTYMVNEKKPMKKQPSLDLASLLRMMRNPTPKLMVELPERIEFLHGKTTSGDLKLDKLNSRAVELETTSGDIDVRLNRKDKELQAKVRTVSGSSRIYGQVNLNDSGVEWEKDPERYIRGEFISSSGDIRVL